MRIPATDVYFVVLPGTMLMDLAGVAEPFRLAERFGAGFQLHFVGPAPLTKTYAGLTLQGIGELPRSLPDGAVVFVPGVPVTDDGSITPSASQAVAWLADVIRPEVLLCTVCSGAFLAGQCGLLDDRQCTTHHTYTARLSKRFPNPPHQRRSPTFALGSPSESPSSEGPPDPGPGDQGPLHRVDRGRTRAADTHQPA